jgi:hypothetical protein
MDHPSRDEMEARLEAIEARSDARAAAFQATVDAFIAVMNERTIHDNQRLCKSTNALRALRQPLQKCGNKSEVCA